MPAHTEAGTAFATQSAERPKIAARQSSGRSSGHTPYRQQNDPDQTPLAQPRRASAESPRQNMQISVPTPRQNRKRCCAKPAHVPSDPSRQAQWARQRDAAAEAAESAREIPEDP